MQQICIVSFDSLVAENTWGDFNHMACMYRWSQNTLFSVHVSQPFLSLSLSDHLSLSLSLLFLLQWRIRPLHPTTSRPRRSQHKPHPLRQGYHARRPHLLVIGVPSPRRVQSPSPLSTICTPSLQSILTFDHAPSFPCLATTGCSLLRWTLCHWYEVRLFV